MKQPNTSSEIVIVPVTGVANIGRGNLSTGAIHFALLNSMLRRQTQVPVVPPIIPSHAGIIGSFEAICRNFQHDVEQISEAFPAARKLFVGHSLGGLLARWYIATHDTDDHLLTIGTPNIPSDCGGLRNLAIGWRWRDINAFTADIPPITSSATRLAQIACVHDGLIPAEVALAPITESAARHLLADRIHDHRPPSGVALHETMLPDNHISMIVSPDSAQAITGIAQTMVAAAAPFSSGLVA